MRLQGPAEALKRNFFRKPLVAGDLVATTGQHPVQNMPPEVRRMFNAPAYALTQIRLTVVSTAPKGIVHIDENTEVELRAEFEEPAVVASSLSAAYVARAATGDDSGDDGIDLRGFVGVCPTSVAGPSPPFGFPKVLWSMYCEASKPTVYRRLDDLRQCDLLVETTRPDPSAGHHHTVYSTTLDRIVVEVEEDSLRLEIDRREDMADRFTRLVEGI
jgi:hypothetical protein